jgi:hypothetical protein
MSKAEDVAGVVVPIPTCACNELITISKNKVM